MLSALIASVGFCILFGLQTVLQQLYVTTQFHPLQLIFLSNLTSALLLTIVSLVFKPDGSVRHYSTSLWKTFSWATSMWILADISAIYGLTLSSGVNFSLITRLQLFITYLGAVMLFDEKKSSRKTVALVLAFLGSLVVVYKAGSLITINFGDMLFLLFTIAISLSGLFRQKVGQGMNAFVMTHYMYLVSAIVLGLLTVLIAPIHSVSSPGFILINSLIGLTGFFCVNYAIARGGATFFTVVSCLLPLTTSLFTFIVFGHIPSITQVVGGTIIIAAIIVFIKPTGAHH